MRHPCSFWSEWFGFNIPGSQQQCAPLSKAVSQPKAAPFLVWKFSIWSRDHQHTIFSQYTLTDARCISSTLTVVATTSGQFCWTNLVAGGFGRVWRHSDRITGSGGGDTRDRTHGSPTRRHKPFFNALQCWPSLHGYQFSFGLPPPNYRNMQVLFLSWKWFSEYLVFFRIFQAKLS